MSRRTMRRLRRETMRTKREKLMRFTEALSNGLEQQIETKGSAESEVSLATEASSGSRSGRGKKRKADVDG